MLLFGRKLFHPNNAQLGLAIMRAGVTHWHAGQIEQGHGMICRAYSILMVTHGPNHVTTKDLEVCHATVHKCVLKGVNNLFVMSFMLAVYACTD